MTQLALSLGLGPWGNVSGGASAKPALDSITSGQPLAAYGIKLLRGAYSGPAFRVIRASDSTSLDIGFVGIQLDNTSLASFLSGTTGVIDKWYDQSGNGNHATQTTSANRPHIGVRLIGGATTIFANSVSGLATSQFFNLPAGLSISKRAADVLAVYEPLHSNLQSTIVQLGSSTNQNTLFQTAVTNQGGLLSGNSVPGNSAFIMQNRPLLYEMNLDTASSFIDQGADHKTGAAGTAITMAGGTIGYTDLNSSFGLRAYYGALLIYGRVLSSGDRTTLRAALATEFSYTENPTTRIVFEGDSITAASNLTSGDYNGYTKQAYGLLNKPVHSYNLAQSGLQATQLTTMYSTRDGVIFGQYSDARIMFLWIGTNDIGVALRTDAQIYADLQTLCGDARASGAKVIVSTILPNSAWNATQQGYWNALNASLRSGWSGFADGLADFQASPVMGPFSAAANHTLYQDGLHPTEFAHGAYLAPIAAAALNTIL